MDQQNPNQSPARHVPTAEEIARLEAEAVAAIQRGEPIPRRTTEAGDGQTGDQAEAAAMAADGEAPAAPPRPTFVPYVDDVPEPEPRPASEAEGAEEDEEEDEEYIPGKWERRIDALTPDQWKRWQIAGGACAGLLAIASLFVFGEDLSTYGLIVAVLLALFLPRYLERAWRRKLTTARTAMIVAMVIGLAVYAVIVGVRHGFVLKTTN